MKINFNDQQCFKAIILKIQDMIEKLPVYIITETLHQNTLVKKLLDRLKRVNRLLYDHTVQSNPTTVYEFSKCLLQVRPGAIKYKSVQDRCY